MPFATFDAAALVTSDRDARPIATFVGMPQCQELRSERLGGVLWTVRRSTRSSHEGYRSFAGLPVPQQI